MFGFGDASDSYNEVHSEGHKSHLSHEVIGAAAAFEGMRLWEQHQRSEGKPVNHALAKELLAGFAGAEAEKLFETKGLDEWDQHKRSKAKEDAVRKSEELYDQHYGGEDRYDPERQRPHEEIRRHHHEHHHHREGDDGLGW